MVHKHVDDVLEEIRLLGGEEAAVQLVNDLLQLRDAVVVILGTVTGETNGVGLRDGFTTIYLFIYCSYYSLFLSH